MEATKAAGDCRCAAVVSGSKPAKNNNQFAALVNDPEEENANPVPTGKGKQQAYRGMNKDSGRGKTKKKATKEPGHTSKGKSPTTPSPPQPIPTSTQTNPPAESTMNPQNAPQRARGRGGFVNSGRSNGSGSGRGLSAGSSGSAPLMDWCSRFGHILMERRKRRNSRLVPGDGLAGMAEEEAVANEGDVLVDYVGWKRDGRRQRLDNLVD
nr:hypothetical protein Iba_chr06bCG9250 [Ipomoea batatas]